MNVKDLDRILHKHVPCGKSLEHFKKHVGSSEYLNYFSALDGSYYRTNSLVLITMARHRMANSVLK